MSAFCVAVCPVTDAGVFPQGPKCHCIFQVSTKPLTRWEERVAVPEHHFPFQELEGQSSLSSPDTVSQQSCHGLDPAQVKTAMM